MFGKIGSLLNSAHEQIGAGVPDWALWILLVLLAGTAAVLIWVTVDYCGNGHKQPGHGKSRDPNVRRQGKAIRKVS